KDGWERATRVDQAMRGSKMRVYNVYKWKWRTVGVRGPAHPSARPVNFREVVGRIVLTLAVSLSRRVRAARRAGALGRLPGGGFSLERNPPEDEPECEVVARFQ